MLTEDEDRTPNGQCSHVVGHLMVHLMAHLMVQTDQLIGIYLSLILTYVPPYILPRDERRGQCSWLQTHLCGDTNGKEPK